MRFKSSKQVKPELVASRVMSHPVLTKVHLNAEASEVWVTDSYMAARFPVELDEGDTSGPIPVDALKAMRKSPMKYIPAKIKLNRTAEVVMDGEDYEDSAPYLTMPREELNYQFPNLTQFFPDNLSDFEIGLSAKLLYDMAKAFGEDRVVLRFTNNPAKAEGDGKFGPSNMRPISVRPMTREEGSPSGILMPIRFDS